MKFYKSVIDDVINNVKEVFVDEGIDENVLMDLRHAWETKLTASQAVANDQAILGLPISHGRSANSQFPSYAQTESAPAARAATQRNARHDTKVLSQFDGIDRGSSSEEEVEDDEDDDDDLIATGVKDEPDDEEEADDVAGVVDVDAATGGDPDAEANATNDANDEGNEEEPLNTDDDVSDDDPEELTETDNVIMCQYDRISRTRNRWKFTLRDGIMNVNGRDFVFSKALGDAEW